MAKRSKHYNARQEAGDYVRHTGANCVYLVVVIELGVAGVGGKNANARSQCEKNLNSRVLPALEVVETRKCGRDKIGNAGKGAREQQAMEQQENQDYVGQSSRDVDSFAFKNNFSNLKITF